MPVTHSPSLHTFFATDIGRPINGVIKAEQRHREAIHDELSEYVVTTELLKHFHRFFEFYVQSLHTPTDKIGVWISGFFGSGKSHFLKILSYLLDPSLQIDGRRPVDYFDGKIADAHLLAEMAKVAKVPSDVMLFNIDSKAEAGTQRQGEAIVNVFWKVFDEMQGYFGAVPHIARLEAYLDSKGQFAAFQAAFERLNGGRWRDERDAHALIGDDIAAALQEVLGLSSESAEQVLERLEANESRSVEDFAKKVMQYLERKGPQHRVLFLVDEVGQYIGENTQLMLNLQTVVENLGIHCQGRAWVMVTSQEDIEGLVKQHRSDDFSKIQGRFNRRISLTSTNTDEVIRLRLLKKTAAATQTLSAYYEQHQASLKNQISFSDDTQSLARWHSAEEFGAAYPFVPYQFVLLQRAFSAIRKAGASGRHLAEGERSMLDSFQLALREVRDKSLGALVPFDGFYHSIEDFLDSGIRAVFANAASNERLEPGIDLRVLRALFMIYRIKEFRPNLENLTTLLIDAVDISKLELRKQIEASLRRLEQQILIQRNGDEYLFLTNDEQEINRAIRQTPVDESEITKFLHDFLASDIYSDKKYKHSAQLIYGFNRKIDGQGHGGEELTLHLLTPFNDQVPSDDASCQSLTMPGDTVLVRLPEQDALRDELRQYLRIQNYTRQARSGQVPPHIEDILLTLARNNEARRLRIGQLLLQAVAEADVFTSGTRLELKKREPRALINEGFATLIGNFYSKLAHLVHHYSDEGQIAAVLAGESGLDLERASNQLARQDLLARLQDWQIQHQPVTVQTLLETFGRRPFGWSELDTLGVLAELVQAGEAELVLQQSPVDRRSKGLVAALRAARSRKEYLVRLPRRVKPEDLKLAQDLAKELFDKPSLPRDPDGLYQLYLAELARLQGTLQTWNTQSRSAYPGHAMLTQALQLVQQLQTQRGAADFFAALRQHEDAVEDLIEQIPPLQGFFKSQRLIFDEALKAVDRLGPDMSYVTDPELQTSWRDVQQLLNQRDLKVFQHLPTLPMLLEPLNQHVAVLQQQHRSQVLAQLSAARTRLQDDFKDARPADFQPLDTLQRELEQASSIDMLLARESRIGATESQVWQILDARRVPPPDPTPDAKRAPVAPTPPVRVQLLQLAPKRVLETQADVTALLDAIETELQGLIGDKKRVQLG